MGIHFVPFLDEQRINWDSLVGTAKWSSRRLALKTQRVLAFVFERLSVERQRETLLPFIATARQEYLSLLKSD